MISNDVLKRKILDSAIHGNLIDNDISLNSVELNQCTGEYLFDIPSNWKWIRFGDLVKDCYQGINTAGDKVEFVESDGVPIIQVGDMTSGKINISNTKLMSYDDYEFYKEKYQPKYNDIFYCNIGTIGCPLIYRENYEMLFHWNIFVIKYNENYSDVVFLKWCLEYYTDIFKNMTSGSAMKFVSKKKLLDTLFPVPPLEEQHRIANKIEELFCLVDRKERNDQESQMLKESLYFKILDKYLCESTNVVKLSNVVEKSSNINWNNETIDYRYVDLTSVDRSKDKITNTTIINKNNAPSRAKQIIKKGDVIFGTTRPLLKRLCCITEEYDNQVCSTGYCVIRPKIDILDTKYLFYCLKNKSFYEYIEPLQRGVSYPAVSDKDVLGYSINVPSLEEQHRIVKKIEQCLELIEQL